MMAIIRKVIMLMMVRVSIKIIENIQNVENIQKY